MVPVTLKATCEVEYKCVLVDSKSIFVYSVGSAISVLELAFFLSNSVTHGSWFA